MNGDKMAGHIIKGYRICSAIYVLVLSCNITTQRSCLIVSTYELINPSLQRQEVFLGYYILFEEVLGGRGVLESFVGLWLSVLVRFSHESCDR